MANFALSCSKGDLKTQPKGHGPTLPHSLHRILHGSNSASRPPPGHITIVTAMIFMVIPTFNG